MSPQAIQMTATICATASAVVSTCVALYAVFRDGKRLKSKEAKELSDRVEMAQQAAERSMQAADRWQDSTHGKVLIAQVDRNGARIARCEQQLENVATKTELAHVEGSISRVEAIVKDVGLGVDRIESMLMSKALNA